MSYTLPEAASVGTVKLTFQSIDTGLDSAANRVIVLAGETSATHSFTMSSLASLASDSASV